MTNIDTGDYNYDVRQHVPRCSECGSEDLETMTIALDGILIQCKNCACTEEVAG